MEFELFLNMCLCFGSQPTPIYHSNIGDLIREVIEYHTSRACWVLVRRILNISVCQGCYIPRWQLFFSYDLSSTYFSRGDHTSLRFVTMCNNGVFNGGIFMYLSIFFFALFVDIKLL